MASKINAILDINADLYTRITDSLKTVKELKGEQISLAKAHYESASKLEKQFAQNIREAIELNSKLDQSERIIIKPTNSMFDSIHMKINAAYYDLVKVQPIKTEDSSSAGGSVAGRNGQSLKLPRVDIPTFNGEITKWPEFIATYDSLIHSNNDLSLIQKFHYLRSSLTGSARLVIQNFQITLTNYPLAYQALVDRYQNPRRIASVYLSNILNFTPIPNNSITSLKSFVDVHRNSIQAITALNLEDLQDFVFLSLALRNLDSRTRQHFEDKHDPHKFPKYNDLLDVVTRQIQILELSNDRSQSHSKAKPQVLLAGAPDTRPNSKASSNLSTKPALSCAFCSKAHSIYACSDFLGLTVHERYAFLRSQNRCFNCLGGHLLTQCPSKSSCRQCGSRYHHSMLHKASPGSQKQPVSPRSSQSSNHASTPSPQCQASSTSDNNSPITSLSCTSKSNCLSQPTLALLGTFVAQVCDSQGRFVSIRGVIDPGSQLSFISQQAVLQLGLPFHNSSLIVTGINASSSHSAGTTVCHLRSMTQDRSLNLEVAVLPHIASHLPSQRFDPSLVSSWQHLALADPNFHVPGKIDILLGADVYSNILSPIPPLISDQGPAAIPTMFGWTFVGQVPSVADSSSTSLLTYRQLSDSLVRFWELESVAPRPQENPLEAAAEQHFLKTHTRDPDGRYIVALPFKADACSLRNNMHRAQASFVSLERRLNKDPNSLNEYQQFMHEYLSLNHMSPAKEPVPYIIPHHVVTKHTPHGPKIRVVFNASSLDGAGNSLNGQLLVGPKLQQDVTDVLLNFRLCRVALTCDVRQMYRQILLKPADRKYQHILWRPQTHDPIEEFELNTVTYGLGPSAFLAVRVIKQLVHDEGDSFPLASKALLNHTYVDDVVSGAESIGSAIALKHELVKLLKRGGFELRKWCSSHPEILSDLPEEHKESPLSFSDEDQALKILGLNWDPNRDVFYFRVIPFSGSVNKRTILSFIARIFDPIGYLAPFVLSLKLFVQQLWSLKCDWDQEIPESMSRSWAQALSFLDSFSRLEIPRCVLPETNLHSIHIVGFADASQSGYAAVIYLTFELDGSRISYLWKAKTRVAPLKPLTIPKLELCAAVLLINLANTVSHIQYPCKVASYRFFSDSQIVLSWLLTPPHTLQTFVSNRVVHILDNSPTNAVWAHIDSSSNPADLGSRGLTPSQMLDGDTSRLWFKGPSFLQEITAPWPPSFSRPNQSFDLPELRTEVSSLATVVGNNFIVDFISSHSSLTRCQRIFAWCRRFIHNCRSKLATHSMLSGPLGAQELEDSLTTLVYYTQQQYFARQIALIQSGQLAKSLVSLSPFIDSAGRLRVGGRLSASTLSYCAKHPLLLPKEAVLSSLICHHYHISALHAGPLTCQALIRRNYWIISLRALIRTVIHRCLTCHRFRAPMVQPIMADLPTPRVVPSRPFTTSGVDFAGPFRVRSSHLRKSVITKGYLCLFVCFATKAVHLEFASELTTDSFFGCLDRFVARRGLPHTIFSDRGTNFVGASKRIEDAAQFLCQHYPDIADHVAKKSIQWKFNPPGAPNFGGLWEAAVKSAKMLLYRHTSDIIFTYEEYCSLFCRIEAVLNSRPLCGLSNDPHESMHYLSPGHFLIGAPLLARPELPSQPSASPVRHWKALQKILDSFWRQWSRDYLNTLIQRSKWNVPGTQLEVGDVVFIRNSTLPPLQWPIARITALHPGKDGVSRVATLATSLGTAVRPVSRLLPLPH